MAKIYYVAFPKPTLKVTKENSTMENELIQLLCEFQAARAKRTAYNRRVNTSIAGTAAEVQYLLTRKQVLLADTISKKTSDSANIVEKMIVRIAELKQEFENLRSEMMDKLLFVLGEQERRCLFRRFTEKGQASMLISLMELYNGWTETSADYFILEARKKHDADRFQKLIDQAKDAETAEKLSAAQKQLSLEYDAKLSDCTDMLEAFNEDIENMVRKLTEEYSMIEVLEEIVDQEYEKISC